MDGIRLGLLLGLIDGKLECMIVGTGLGPALGTADDAPLGLTDGTKFGKLVGSIDGISD